jgi:hypothetical protein
MKHKKRCQPPNLGNLPAQPSHTACFWWLAPFLLAVAGCGSGGPTRLRVVGAVTLDGQPLADGARGPTPGEYRVEIRASAPSGKQLKDSFGQSSVAEMESIIPTRYNDKTTLRAEITAAGPNQFDYSLSTSPE